MLNILILSNGHDFFLVLVPSEESAFPSVFLRCVLKCISKVVHTYSGQGHDLLLYCPHLGEGERANLENGLKWGRFFLINKDFQSAD